MSIQSNKVSNVPKTIRTVDIGTIEHGFNNKSKCPCVSTGGKGASVYLIQTRYVVPEKTLLSILRKESFSGTTVSPKDRTLYLVSFWDDAIKKSKSRSNLFDKEHDTLYEEYFLSCHCKDLLYQFKSRWGNEICISRLLEKGRYSEPMMVSYQEFDESLRDFIEKEICARLRENYPAQFGSDSDDDDSAKKTKSLKYKTSKKASESKSIKKRRISQNSKKRSDVKEAEQNDSDDDEIPLAPKSKKRATGMQRPPLKVVEEKLGQSEFFTKEIQMDETLDGQKTSSQADEALNPGIPQSITGDVVSDSTAFINDQDKISLSQDFQFEHLFDSEEGSSSSEDNDAPLNAGPTDAIKDSVRIPETEETQSGPAIQGELEIPVDPADEENDGTKSHFPSNEESDSVNVGNDATDYCVYTPPYVLDDDLDFNPLIQPTNEENIPPVQLVQEGDVHPTEDDEDIPPTQIVEQTSEESVHTADEKEKSSDEKEDPTDPQIATQEVDFSINPVSTVTPDIPVMRDRVPRKRQQTKFYVMGE